MFFVGDYIPAYAVLRRGVLPCSPADAAAEIREICTYVSPYAGGQGCVRDVIEQVLRAQNVWMTDATAFGW